MAGDECGLGLRVFRVTGLGQYAGLGMRAIKGSGFFRVSGLGQYAWLGVVRFRA